MLLAKHVREFRRHSVRYTIAFKPLQRPDTNGLYV